MNRSVLIADDEEDLRANIGRFLERKGFEVELARDGGEALAKLRARAFDAALLDVRMSGLSGLDLLEKARVERPETRVVIMTAYASVESAVSALRGGAADYLLKPFDLETVATKLALLTESHGKAARLGERFPTLIAASAEMSRVLRLAEQMASASSTILFTGESGTGKEVIARAVHDAGPRGAEPFVAVNCGALPEQLVESELFGHERGAFSGALSAKRGLFEVAEKGTIFLDEVGDLPLAVQVKLLRAIERKEVRRVGATEEKTVDVRIMAATNRDLRALVREGGFREDLFYRLAVFEIVVPPLRDRRADVRPLAERFLKRHAVELGKRVEGFAPAAIGLLEGYPWPGNVRELENAVARAALTAKGPQVQPLDLVFPGAPTPERRVAGTDTDDLRTARTAFERAHVRRVLEKFGDDKVRAAAALGIDVSSLYRKLGKNED